MINFQDLARIPGGFETLEAFRCWARSDKFPDRGRYAYLNGETWVDLSMEQLFTHNLVKTQFTVALGALVDAAGLGYLFSDGTLLSNAEADLSTEPDCTFVSYETMRSAKVRSVKGANEGYVELEGTPDMVLEVVSTTSVRKDTETLRSLYWRSGIGEYWLVDARGDEPSFIILRHTARSYQPTRAQAGGWLRSAAFGRSFRLAMQSDPLGNPRYVVEVR